MDAEKQSKKPGPKTRLTSPERFNTTLPARHRQVLEAYSEQEDISIAAALRAAIDLLEKRCVLFCKPLDIPE